MAKRISRLNIGAVFKLRLVVIGATSLQRHRAASYPKICACDIVAFPTCVRSLFYFPRHSLSLCSSATMKFLATIYKVWIMRHVDVPEHVAVALIADMRRVSGTGAKARSTAAAPKHIPVIATVNRMSVKTTLVPAGAGRYRLTAQHRVAKGRPRRYRRGYRRNSYLRPQLPRDR